MSWTQVSLNTNKGNQIFIGLPGQSLTFTGSGFIVDADDYSCRFATQLVICPMLPIWPSPLCGEPEVRIAPAATLSPTTITCEPPNWDLPAMPAILQLTKAGTLVPGPAARVHFRARVLPQPTPAAFGAGGGADITVAGRGFDPWPEYTKACPGCEPPGAYTCAFESAGPGPALRADSPPVRVPSVTSLICRAPVWPLPAGPATLSILRAPAVPGPAGLPYLIGAVNLTAYEELPAPAAPLLAPAAPATHRASASPAATGPESVSLPAYGLNSSTPYDCVFTAAAAAAADGAGAGAGAGVTIFPGANATTRAVCCRLAGAAGPPGSALLDCPAPEWPHGSALAAVAVRRAGGPGLPVRGGGPAAVVRFRPAVARLEPAAGPAVGFEVAAVGAGLQNCTLVGYNIYDIIIL
jgi:hypothetical protein